MKTFDIFNLDNDQVIRLTERINKWNGLVRLFVHPLFEKWRAGSKGYQAYYSNFDRLLEIESVLTRLLSMPEHKTPPLLVMQEGIFMEEFLQWIDEGQACFSHSPYIIKTCNSSPTPACSTSSSIEAWNKLTTLLKKVGVRKLLVAGMQLEVCHYKQDWTHKGPYLARCVGIALSHLCSKKGGIFETELSALIEPAEQRRRYFQNVDFTEKIDSYLPAVL